MLGVFDSGLGGLSVVRRLRERLPHQELLFFGDQAHVPYGDRSPEELTGLLAQNVSLLNAAGAAMIVMGCNTSCAIAQQFGWPPSSAPILDLIESAAFVVERERFRNVGVVATSATVRAGAYTRAIAKRMPSAAVCELAAPALVPLVEAGKAGTQEAHEAVAAVCARLPANLDAVVLACTHYPILDLHFADALGESVVLVDPAIEQAERAATLIAGNSIARGIAAITYVTNGNLEAFRIAVRMITGEFDPKCMALDNPVAVGSNVVTRAQRRLPDPKNFHPELVEGQS